MKMKVVKDINSLLHYDTEATILSRLRYCNSHTRSFHCMIDLPTKTTLTKGNKCIREERDLKHHHFKSTLLTVDAATITLVPPNHHVTALLSTTLLLLFPTLPNHCLRLYGQQK